VTFLLDVNVLLALRYMDHVHYERVDRWATQLETERRRGHVVFATCPITELGFVRVGSGPAAYAPSVDAARDDLQDLKASESLLFIPADLYMRHLPAWVRKSGQTTDGYLLALAKSRDGELATLDGSIPGALLIPDEAAGPLTVRDAPAVYPEWVTRLPSGMLEQTESRGIIIR
jgi:predicted nucleic acid-binding protein